MSTDQHLQDSAWDDLIELDALFENETTSDAEFEADEAAAKAILKRNPYAREILNANVWAGNEYQRKLCVRVENELIEEFGLTTEDEVKKAKS